MPFCSLASAAQAVSVFIRRLLGALTAGAGSFPDVGRSCTASIRDSGTCAGVAHSKSLQVHLSPTVRRHSTFALTDSETLLVLAFLGSAVGGRKVADDLLGCNPSLHLAWWRTVRLASAVSAEARVRLWPAWQACACPWPWAACQTCFLILLVAFLDDAHPFSRVQKATD